MGVVVPKPEDLAALYGDDYYRDETDDGVGYEDYSYTAEHSLGWAASLVELLTPSGRILDIGCADGHLLGKLSGRYECAGIEVNRAMIQVAERRGVRIVGSDLMAIELPLTFAGHFDVIFALSVLEHMPDIKRAARIAVDMLKPDGVLLFEVPLISPPDGDDDIWFRSSLEHVFYPSEAAIEHLFRHEIGVSLYGRAVVIQGYGSTYVGAVTKSETRSVAVERLFTHLLDGPLNALDDASRDVRVLFDLVHAARRTPELILGLRSMWSVGTEELWKRLIDLWLVTQVDLDTTKAQLDEVRTYLAEVEAARDWHSDEASKWRLLAEGSDVGERRQRPGNEPEDVMMRPRRGIRSLMRVLRRLNPRQTTSVLSAERGQVDPPH